MTHDRVIRPIAALLVALALAACGGEAEPSASGSKAATLSPIRPAPDFELDTLDGDTLTLADLDGRKAVLMNLWASWCLPCKEEIPELIALHEEYLDQGLAILGVTVNDLPRDSRAFVQELGIPYPSVIGTPAMLEAYGVSPWLPTTLLIKDRQIVREWVGPQTREDFEYPVRVALGLAPPLGDVIQEERHAGW